MRGGESLGRNVVLLLASALACTRANPAFDGDESSDTATASLDTSSMTSPSETSDSQDTLDTLGTSDTTDTTDTTDTATSETGDEPACMYNPRPPLRMVVRSPEPCPDSIGDLTIALHPPFNVEPGIANGSVCSDEACNQCGLEDDISIGAPGFAGIANMWTTLAGLLEPNGLSDSLCVQISTTQLLASPVGECFYGGMGIYDSSIEHGPVFVGQVDDAPLTGMAMNLLGGQALIRNPLGTCSCMSLFADKPDEVTCCEAAAIEPYFSTLTLFDTELAPGEQASVNIFQITWQFDVLQSQDVPSCGNPTGKSQMSWALTRQQ